MSKPTSEQRLAALERKVQALAQDYSEQVYGNPDALEWDDDGQGWLHVPPGKVVADAR